MITPFARMNTATLRAERRARLRRLAGDLACLAALALLAAIMGHVILTTALNLPATLTQAEALKGM
jgi:hypothetical protein